MALTTIQTNNKLIKFTRQVNREWVRENLFAPYMGESITAIIRKRMELTSGGEQMNIPLVARLAATAIASGALAGNEENVDNYGMRVWIDWARNAIKTNKAEKQKDSSAIFDVARPLLSDWLKELSRDETVDALYALPTESAPAGLGSAAGQRVNGILLDSSTATQRNTWLTDNSDRVVFGALKANTVSGVFLTAAGTLDTTADLATTTNMKFLKRVARNANPHIRPFQLKDGREYFVAFHGSRTFRDLKASLDTVNSNVRPREGDGMNKNPIFQDGDQLYDGVIHREIPEIDVRAPATYTGIGSGSVDIRPVWLCGQSAMAFAYGQMAKPTQLDNTDYQFNQGVGIETAYGVAKMFKKTTGGLLKEWGIATGFYAATADA
jgi:uncharacterized protein DUF4043